MNRGRPLVDAPSPHTAYMREWRAAHPENLAYMRSYNATRYGGSARPSAWYNANRDRVVDRERQRIYGLSPDQFDTLYDKQHGECAVCFLPFGAGRRVFVDHNHASGKTRALLCPRCNTAVGTYESAIGPMVALYVSRDGLNENSFYA